MGSLEFGMVQCVSADLFWRAARMQFHALPGSKSRILSQGFLIKNPLISYGAMMRPCKEAVEDLADDHNINVELIDLLTISPMDTATLTTSVQKTGRCVIVHEGHRTCGVASEIIARLNESVFEYLEAPIKRITGFDIPFPYFQVEEHFLPESEEIVQAIKETIEWR